MNHFGFHQFTLPLKENLFSELSNSIVFEDLAKGRRGTNLVDVSDQGVPIVRTTSKYYQPAHAFSSVHHLIVKSIQDTVKQHQEVVLPSSPFNNALIEIYNQEYTKMKYHSDQCLDLENDSFIALFSCYERPDDLSEHTIRKLKVKSKVTDEEFTLSLTHHSLILFSLSTNTQYLHKIILETKQKPLASDNRWLGITFRKSKTLLQFKDALPYLPNGALLTLAEEAERKAFYKLRGQENKSRDFIYPTLTYTLSESDLLVPKSN